MLNLLNPFQNTLKSVATDKLGKALKEALEHSVAQAKQSADLDENGVNDFDQLIDNPDPKKPSAFEKIVTGITQAATVGGFAEFFAECQEFAERIKNPKMAEGVNMAIEGGKEIAEYFSKVSAKFMPKKVAEGQVAEGEAAQA